MNADLKKIIVRMPHLKSDTPGDEWNRATRRAEIAHFVAKLKKHGGHDSDIMLPENPLGPGQFHIFCTEAVKQKMIDAFPHAIIEDDIQNSSNATSAKDIGSDNMQPSSDMVRTVIFIRRPDATPEERQKAIAVRNEVIQAAKDMDPARTAIIDAPEDAPMALIDCSVSVADTLKTKFPGATIAPERYLPAAKPVGMKFRM